jgi:putative transposase
MEPRVKYDPEKHHRRSIRLRGYDYAGQGAYFVTICAQNRACLFGAVAGGEMQLNNAGRMIERWWFELNHKFPTVETDEFVVMPNHFHGIVVIADVTVGADLCVGPVSEGTHAGVPLQGVHPVRPIAHPGARRGAPRRASLPTVIQWFKTMTTNEYMRGVNTLGWTPFHGQLWQRNYYEHIIRDEESLDRIRRYIIDNPARWTTDRENPSATTFEPENAWRL